MQQDPVELFCSRVCIMSLLLTIKNPFESIFIRPSKERYSGLIRFSSLHCFLPDLQPRFVCKTARIDIFYFRFFCFFFYNVLLLEECYCAICPKQPDKQVGFFFLPSSFFFFFFSRTGSGSGVHPASITALICK